MSADAEHHLQQGPSNMTIEYRGQSLKTVHLRIVCALPADIIEKRLELISKTLQRADASDVSIAVSISDQAFRPTATDPTNAGWMAPLRSADE